MTSNGKIYKLRKINRALFDQLESNSALLENKLRKLKESTRSPKDFTESCQSSSLKKQHQSWKMRNDSIQMLEVLNSEFTTQSNSNGSTPYTEILQGEDEDITKELTAVRPSVKSKRKKLGKGTKRSFAYNNPERITQQKAYSESRYNAAENKRNELLYNTSKKAFQINNKNQHLRTLTDNEESVSLGKHKTLNTEPRKQCVSGRTVDDKLLKEVGNIIDYSPKSTFLRRLKERSQRNIYNSIRSPRKSVYIKSQTPVTSSPNTSNKEMKRTVLSTEENQMKSSLKETAKTANSCCSCLSSPCYCWCSIMLNTPALKAKEILLKQKKSRNHLKKKRVCYRRNCYCRSKALRGTPSSSKKSAKKENWTSAVSEVDRSLNTPYSYRRCCNLYSPNSKVDKAALGHIFSVRDKEENLYCCTCKETGSWFNGLRKFRDSHWFDCHAKPISVCSHPNEHRILQNHCKCYQEDQHTCVHQYVVNDRLFMQPVCEDHKGRSRCVYCKLPRNRERASYLPQNKAEPSKEEVLVSLPLSMLCSERNKSSLLSNKREDSKKSPYRRSVRQKRSPPPANSLALRFQKGIL